MNTRIGIVGLGKMGSAFAQRLLNEGHTVAVWDRTPHVATTFATAFGGVPYSSLSDLVAAVDVVLVMLWGDDVAIEVTLAQIVPMMQPKQVLVEMSTLSPQMYATLEQAAQQRGIDFVASPVLGNPDQARSGGLTVLPGGDEDAIAKVHDVLASLGTVIPLNSTRASGFLKLANNTVLGVVAETLRELLSLCDRAGIDADLAARLFTGTFQRAAQQKLPQLLDRDSEPRFALGALLKDLHLARDAGQSLNISLPVLDVTVPEAERAVERGLGNRDYIALAIDRSAAAVS